MSGEEKSEKKEVKRYKVLRDGEVPLRFEGTLLADVDNSDPSGRDSFRWDEYRLYRTTAGAYVLVHVYRTQWQNEDDSHEAWHGVDPHALLVSAARWWTNVEEGGMPRLLVELAEKAGLDVAEHIA